VESARELIGRAGFQRASLEDVARRAGVTRATVYQHFGSKQGLLEALLASSSVVVAPSREREALALAHPGAALRSLIAQQVRLYSADAAVLSRVHGLADASGTAGADPDQARRVQLALIVVGLGERGQLRPGCTRREAFEALCMLTGFTAFEHLHLRSGLDAGAVENTLLALSGGIVAWEQSRAGSTSQVPV
jgi:AcrR family transcriptional regulator